MYKTNVGILCSLICFLSRPTSNVRYSGIDVHYNMYIWDLKRIILPKYIYYEAKLWTQTGENSGGKILIMGTKQWVTSKRW